MYDIQHNLKKKTLSSQDNKITSPDYEIECQYLKIESRDEDVELRSLYRDLEIACRQIVISRFRDDDVYILSQGLNILFQDLEEVTSLYLETQMFPKNDVNRKSEVLNQPR